MFGFEQLNQQVANIVRVGKVSAVYPERHSVRCTFEDKGGLVSAEMPVLISFANKNKMYALPDIGDTVACLMQSNDLTAGSGFIIGCIYSNENPPAEIDSDTTRIDFSDETFFSYNRRTHEFTMHFNEKSEIIFDGNYGELSINIKGNTLINIDKRLEIAAKDEILVESRADISMDAKNIRLN